MSINNETTRCQNTPSGLILLHKPPGITSFDALRDIKRALNTGKAGHTGTLDKFAEGLLLVLTGRALKLSIRQKGHIHYVRRNAKLTS